MKIEIKKKWLIVGGIGALVIVAVAVIALASGGSGNSAAEAPASSAEIEEVAGEVEAAEGEALQECIDLWNKPSNSAIRQELTVLVPEYVSVTMSSVYEDKCLITAANPELDLADQFLEGGNTSGATYSATESGSAATLPASVTNWNASVKPEGRLVLRS